MNYLRVFALLLLLAVSCEKEPAGGNRIVTFTDKSFEKYCLGNIHINPHHHERLTVADVEAVKTLTLGNYSQDLKNARTLNDLRLFVNAEKISLGFEVQHISQMDITTLRKLRQLDLTIGSFTSLDLSGNPLLDSLDCGFNPISHLDLSHNPCMKWLSVAQTDLTSIDLSGLPLLENFDCSYTTISALNLSANPKLASISFNECPIRSIDFSPNPLLEFVWCDKSLIEKLELRHCRRLSMITAPSCDFLRVIYANKTAKAWAQIFAAPTTLVEWIDDPGASVDAEGNIDFPDWRFEKHLLDHFDTDNDGHISLTEAAAITRLDMPRSSLVSLDGIQYFENLETLSCPENHINDLDLSRNKKLTGAVLTDCKLETLDISGCHSLKTLLCASNTLTTIDLSSCPALEALNISGNQIFEVDLHANTQLQSLACSSNLLNELTLYSPGLELLNCSENSLFTLDVSRAAALVSLNCAGNLFSELDLRSNQALQTLNCRGCHLLDIIRLAPGHTLLSLEKEDFTRVVYE